MFSFFILFGIACLPHLTYTSVSFILNPNCDIPDCQQFNQRALYYGYQIIDNNKIHIVYSSFGELTIMMMQTDKAYSPTFNYTALAGKDYSNAFKFNDTKPLNSFTIILRRLMEYNDTDDKATMKDDDNTTISYYLSDATITNLTLQNDTTTQPSFEYQLPTLNGTLKIDILYPGTTMRDKKFPKLRTEPSSYFLNIVLKANNYSFANPRFAYELYTISPDVQDPSLVTTKFIDDQYTPGIFNVWQMKRPSNSLYPSSMLWKPVVYLSQARTIEENTLMHIYSIQNHIQLNETIDQGIYYAIFTKPNISAFNVSLGETDDGFFSKNNYGFIQFTAGLDALKLDATAQFVTIALIGSLALPGVVALVAVIFMIKRRISNKTPSSYNAIST